MPVPTVFPRSHYTKDKPLKQVPIKLKFRKFKHTVRVYKKLLEQKRV